MRLFAYTLALSLAAPTGCDSDEDEFEADPVVVERSTSTLSAVVDLAHVAQQFKGAAYLRLFRGEVAATEAIKLVRARVEGIFQAIGCQANFETDEATFLNLDVPGCTVGGFLTIRGGLDATVIVEFDGADVPAALVWNVGGPGFTTGVAGREVEPAYSGEVELRLPIPVNETEIVQRATWQTQPGFSIDVGVGSFELRSTAAWEVDADDCVTMDLEAELQLSQLEDDLDIEIGDIVVAADELRRCQARCPESGTVRLSYGTGQLLSWTYRNDSTVVVSGPGGREFSFRLSCGDGDVATPVDQDGG